MFPIGCAISELRSYADATWGALNDAFEAAINALEEKEAREYGCAIDERWYRSDF